MMRLSIVATLGGALLLAARAQAGIGVEANSRATGRWGGEFGVGYRFKLAECSLTPGGGVFVSANESDRYDRQTVSNGNKVCRDTSNGQFADKENCGPHVCAYGLVEAACEIPLVATVGASARISDKVRFYGTVALPLGPVAIKGNAGPKYYALGVTFGY